jgi:peptide/nickel transport system substrate-binding protein
VMQSTTRTLTRRTLLFTASRAVGVMAAGTLWTLLSPGHAAGRTVRIGLQTDVNTLDPHMTNTVGTDLSVISHLYSSLVTRGPDLKLHPQIAESWTPVSDTRWRFVLRRGITFPNGERLDAEAVKPRL